MRTAILFGCVYIGKKISSIEMPKEVIALYGIIGAACIVMDIIEFFAKLSDKK